MKYSFIVPVYGVEQYLDGCVKSILAQSFSDFEVILVDDVSPDRCPEMCDEWAKKDPRIRVIHKEQNGGLGFARNTGMEKAQGQYLLFLDSDDSVAPDLLEVCDKALKEDPDILVFGLEYVYEDKNGNVTLREKATPGAFWAKSPKEIASLFTELNRKRAFPYAWNKIYRREFLLQCGTLFEKTKLIEDFLFNIDLFGKASVIGTVDRAFYYYRKPTHETLASRYDPEFFQLCKRKYSLEKRFLEQCGSPLPEQMDLIRQSFVKHFVSTAIKNRSKKASLSRKEQLSAIQKMAEDPLTVEVMGEYRPSDIKYRLLCSAIAKKQCRLVLLFATGIDFVQSKMLTLFRKMVKRG